MKPEYLLHDFLFLIPERNQNDAVIVPEMQIRQGQFRIKNGSGLPVIEAVSGIDQPQLFAAECGNFLQRPFSGLVISILTGIGSVIH